MRNPLKLQSMLLAVVAIAAISAAWLLTWSPPASSRPALRGTTLEEPEEQPGAAHESRSDAQASAKVAAQDAPSDATSAKYFAVICEAGCNADGANVVGLTPQGSRRVPGNARAQRRIAGADEAVCIGGCYKNDAGLASVGGIETVPQVPQPASLPRHETSPREAKHPAASTSGRWYDRIGDPSTL
jgi:hypothetical protein